jgi:hypothetical protein
VSFLPYDPAMGKSDGVLCSVSLDFRAGQLNDVESAAGFGRRSELRQTIGKVSS